MILTQTEAADLDQVVLSSICRCFVFCCGELHRHIEGLHRTFADAQQSRVRARMAVRLIKHKYSHLYLSEFDYKIQLRLMSERQTDRQTDTLLPPCVKY